jgi:hypothetical protein
MPLDHQFVVLLPDFRWRSREFQLENLVNVHIEFGLVFIPDFLFLGILDLLHLEKEEKDRHNEQPAHYFDPVIVLPFQSFFLLLFVLFVLETQFSR